MQDSMVMGNFNRCSNPSELKITDMRFVDIDGAPKRCTLLKIMTNQGLVGYGEVRDASSKTYALMLKSRILGENPCDVDRIFRKIKQFGGPSRQGGGVCGIEIALWDLAGKAYGVPLYQMLGGKFRDEVRVYCDTDVDGKHTGHDMGLALKKRLEMGFTFLKMDLGIGLLMDEPGALNAPLGFIDDMKKYAPHILNVQGGSVTADMVKHQKSYSIVHTAHPFTGIHLTEHGLDVLEDYVRQVREVIGYEVPLAIDHFGHVCVEDCIRFAKRMEPYNLAWIEDMVPWMYTDQYVRLRNSTTIPVCTGEDIYLKEGFETLIKAGGVSVIHPDILLRRRFGIKENRGYGKRERRCRRGAYGGKSGCLHGGGADCRGNAGCPCRGIPLGGCSVVGKHGQRDPEPRFCQRIYPGSYQTRTWV